MPKFLFRIGSRSGRGSAQACQSLTSPGSGVLKNPVVVVVVGHPWGQQFKMCGLTNVKHTKSQLLFAKGLNLHQLCIMRFEVCSYFCIFRARELPESGKRRFLKGHSVRQDDYGLFGSFVTQQTSSPTSKLIPKKNETKTNSTNLFVSRHTQIFSFSLSKWLLLTFWKQFTWGLHPSSLSLSLSHLYLSPHRVEKGGNWITTFLDLESFNTFQAWTEQTIDLDSKTKQNLYDEIKMAFISDLVVMGWDSRSEDCGFESHTWSHTCILYKHFFRLNLLYKF